MKSPFFLKSLLAAGAVLAALPALAADIPTQTYEPQAAVPFSWTGFYVGGHIGGGWGSADIKNLPAPINLDGNGGGFIGGAHAGYNLQLNQFVVGIEGDIDLSALKTTTSFFPPIESRQDWLASVRGRAGYAFDRLLVYGTGGVAFTNFKYSAPGVPSSVFKSGSSTGWVAGVGAEYALTDNWIAGVEWKHYEFGKKSFAKPLPGVKISHSQDTIMARLSYKF